MVGSVVMNNGNVYYVSTGTAGKVSVTISSGKITAILTGVGMKTWICCRTLPPFSGTLHGQ
jgi:hypothetical protein